MKPLCPRSLPPVTLLCLSLLASSAPAENWPAWRGPRGDGSSHESTLPTTWNAATGENIAWKTPIPGVGHSSPIIWEDRIFVVTCLGTAVGEPQERALLCLDRKSGEILWRQTVLSAPLEKKHSLNSHASGTPATDGKRVYVSFLAPDFASLKERTPGDMVVAAFDFAGTLQWEVRPGRFASTHGFCSSPVLFEDKLIVNGDHDGDGYIVALARETGRELWRIQRPFNTRSYVTPIIRDLAGRTQMLLSGSKCVASYDPRTGQQHWIMDGPTEQFVASLVDDGRFVYLTAGFPEKHILALKPDGNGQVSDEQIVWRTQKNCSYVPSPIICGEYFLITSDEGIGSCYQAQTGTLQWTARLGKHYSGSLVTADGLVYFTADDGITKVIRPGPKLDILAENTLGEYCYSSPALSQNQIFIRTEKQLYCIGK